MWSAITGIVLKVIQWLWGGRQQAEGEAQGKAEQALADVNQEMLDEQKAQAARARAALSSGVVVSDPNNSGVRRR